jgi:surfactin synthase thioesterase subunit
MSEASIQLFCFPHAGASAAPYVRWRRFLSSWIEVVPVELAGHGRRVAEPLETTMSGLLAQAVRVLRRDPGRPYALFGHSLGALIAFEYARALQQEGARAPLLTFASGSRAPSCRAPSEGVRESDAELRDELLRLDGTPALALADPELMRLTLPWLRADFQVADGYRCPAGARIASPVHVLAGRDDDVSHESLEAWRGHTCAEFALDRFPGGHFFIHEQQTLVLATIERALAAKLGRRRADCWVQTNV